MKTTKQNLCTCKEMSCTEDCDRDHTHKGFSCEKCEPTCCQQTLQELLDEVEGEKKIETKTLRTMRNITGMKPAREVYTDYEARGFNQALDTITTIIRRRIDEI